MAARWPAVALFASLALNLFLLGIVVGDWTRARATPAAPATAETVARGAIQRLLSSVPGEYRDGVEKRLLARRGEIQRANQQLRATRERLATLAGADPLDRGQLDQAYAELRERNMAVQKAIHVAVTEAIAELPAEARRAIIAGLTGGARR